MRHYRGWLLGAAAVMVMTWTPFCSYGASTFILDDYYDEWASGADDEDDRDTLQRDGDEDTGNGPGIILDGEAAGGGELPGVHKMEITERYHEEFAVYEESIGDIFFFYSSVANGGITDKPVTMDIPVNLSYTMEKDGEPYPYTAGQTVTQKGTYILRLSGVEDRLAPLSEQQEYRAVYRFRIQDKPPETGEAAGGGSGLLSGIAGGSGSTYSRGETSGSVQVWGDAGSLTMDAGEPESRPAEEGNEEDGVSGDAVQEPELLDGDISDDSDAGEAEPGTEDDTDTGSRKQQKRIQEYDRSLGRYLVTLENGKSLVSNIPEGLIFPGSVELVVPEEDVELVKLYLNDQPLEYVRGDSLVGEGTYRMELDGAAYSFTIASSVSALDIFPAPAGMAFTEAYLDDQPLELLSPDYVPLEQDGQYRLVMEGEKEDRLEVSLKMDTEAPVVEVSVGGGRADIQYLSQDISRVVIRKNGGDEEVFNANLVDEPGTYRLTAWDAAGNQSSVEFELKYQINTYGIAAVVLVILVAAGISAFVIHTKKTIKIR